MSIVIAFNGAPGSGKSYMANQVAETYNVPVISHKNLLRGMLCGMFLAAGEVPGLNEQHEHFYARAKSSTLHGMLGRDLQIICAEAIKAHDKLFFCRDVQFQLRRQPFELGVIDDVGFGYELDALAQEHVVIFVYLDARIPEAQRTAALQTFHGDSRVNLSHLATLINPTLEELLAAIDAQIVFATAPGVVTRQSSEPAS